MKVNTLRMQSGFEKQGTHKIAEVDYNNIEGEGVFQQEGLYNNC